MLTRPRTQRGMSLVELLVALVIASLGLLTLVGLQAASLRYTRVSERRAVASLLAGDLMERIRANTAKPADLKDYAFSETFASQESGTLEAPAVTCDTTASNCDMAAMAKFDLYQWRLAVRRLLPQGAVMARVSQDPAKPADANRQWLDLWIAWRDPVMHQAGDVRAAGECPEDLKLVATADDTVRCMTWRVRP